ncbi:MAG: nuclear transport factor 2 family protein [Gemmatimonadales bacterium]|jgi:hypothetical protein
MRSLTRLSILAVPVAALAVTAAFSTSSDDDIRAVRATVQHYLDGHATGDAEVMARAFHPSARLQFVRDGQVSIRSLEDYLGGFTGRPAADEPERHRRVVMVDYAGTAAVAKIELDYPQALITDYMQLLEIDGEWKIVNKVFHVERK